MPFAGADTPAESRHLAEQLSDVPLGSAVPYTVMLQHEIFGGRASAIADLNLDADRGWAHRNWTIDAGAEGSVAHDSTNAVPYDWAE